MRSNALPKQKSGFTLIELMIVVIIIGVLAGLAIPRFIKTAEKVRGEKAVSSLSLILTGESMYMLDYNEFANDLDLLARYIFIGEFASDPNWTYGDPDITDDPADPGPDFTAIATRSGGVYSGGTITIDEDGNISTGGDWPFTY